VALGRCGSDSATFSHGTGATAGTVVAEFCVPEERKSWFNLNANSEIDRSFPTCERRN
jgi:hypothetical protein